MIKTTASGPRQWPRLIESLAMCPTPTCIHSHSDRPKPVHCLHQGSFITALNLQEALELAHPGVVGSPAGKMEYNDSILCSSIQYSMQ